ncbi:MAG: molybdopterin molybdenumtransferase MoeA [Planctomycetota bacterium]|nr:MAG: molybdopterin molybdenumtransferase MoeA [Planctomycetota bacterium]
MRGFAQRSTVDEALAWLRPQWQRLEEEVVPVADAHDRVLARAIESGLDVPQFRRAMMDGFAVVASDTQGATAYNRLTLNVIGEAWPGRPFAGHVESGSAVKIMTGAPLPKGANAVLPVEETETIGDQVALLGEVPAEKHVGRVGEDIDAGSTVLAAGRCLRPQDLGVLSSIAMAQVPVVRRPRVRIVVTGNELLPAGSRPGPYEIVDANGPMLTALIERDGGEAVYPGIVPDDREAITAALTDDCDVVLVSGGSSVGQEDFVPLLLAEQGELAIHGIAMRPSSPAGMGRLGPRLVFLLPGNPVSCLCAYDFFAGPTIRALGGRSTDWPYLRKRLKLARKLVSVVGRVDYARVAINEDDEVEPLAISGASILSSTTRADGFVIVPGDSEGSGPGSEVEVFLYDR